MHKAAMDGQDGLQSNQKYIHISMEGESSQQKFNGHDR